MEPPVCRRCGTRPNVDAAHERREQRLNGIPVLEPVDSPPLPGPTDGFRSWGDRVDSWDVLTGGNLMRKDRR